MRLDPACVRAILLEVEAAEYGVRITPEKLHEALPEYSENDIDYTCLTLSDGGFLDVLTVPMVGLEIPSVRSVTRLTYKGHEFLNGIRDDKNWTLLQKGARAVRNYSLEAIEALSKGITDAAISKFLTEACQKGL